jgi:hypothetical protein
LLVIHDTLPEATLIGGVRSSATDQEYIPEPRRREGATASRPGIS